MKRERRKGDRKRRKKRRKRSISHSPLPLCCQISWNLNGVRNGVGWFTHTGGFCGEGNRLQLTRVVASKHT